MAVLAAACLAMAAPIPTAVAPAPVPLENTRWELASIGGVPARTAAQGPYVLFRPGEGGRRLGGATGCNGLKGSYDVFAGRLRISAVALTGRPCTAPLASQETKLVEALRDTANYRIAGPELTLMRADGRVLARFAARTAP